MKFYAGLGSRETPADVLDLMQEMAYRLSLDGWCCRTGAAPGADQAFATGAGRDCILYLPWPQFEAEFVNRVEGWPMDAPYGWTFPIAAQFHPAWDRLSQGVKRLHARNVHQILGSDQGDTPSAFVVCWTKDGKASGGTGQAIRIAEAYGIPVRNLHDPKTREAAERFVRGE